LAIRFARSEFLILNENRVPRLSKGDGDTSNFTLPTMSRPSFMESAQTECGGSSPTTMGSRWRGSMMRTRSVVKARTAYMTTSDGLLFADERGGYLRNTNWRRRAFAPAVGRAKLTPLRVHDLRHTAASLSIHAGASVKSVQSQLGHASATMTLDRYSHLWPDELEALSAALDVVASRAAADSLRTPEADGEVVALADHR
jgi:Phage integrase family